MSGTKVTVCAECRQASCWQGMYLCETARRANTVEVDVEVLRAEAREHPSWWDVCERHAVSRGICKCGLPGSAKASEDPR